MQNSHENRIYKFVERYYHNDFGNLPNVEMERLMIDTDLGLKTPLEVFLFMWCNSGHKEEMERLFEVMTACPIDLFICNYTGL